MADRYYPESPKLSSMFYSLYGTDKNSRRTTYENSIYNAVTGYYSNYFNNLSFFKSYSNTQNLGLTLLPGFMGLLGVAYIICAVLGAPEVLIAHVAVPALIALGFALTSLILGLHHTCKGDYNSAAEYYLDATTRLFLVIPLLALEIVKIVPDAISLLTRSAKTLIDYMESLLKRRPKSDEPHPSEDPSMSPA